MGHDRMPNPIVIGVVAGITFLVGLLVTASVFYGLSSGNSQSCEVDGLEEYAQKNRDKINGLKGAMSALYGKLKDQKESAQDDRQDIKRQLETLMGSASRGSQENNGRHLLSRGN